MFACVCAQKSVELGPDRKQKRALQDQQLVDEVQGLLLCAPTPPCAAAPPAGPVQAFSSGGGVRIDGQDAALSLASVDTCIAVFQGQLKNAAELARKCSSTSGATGLLSAGVEGGGSAAEILCRLYISHGVDLLSMLRGTFSFCLYESRTERVLASSDTSGAITLYEGRTASGALIVASSCDYLTACTDVVQFQPGDYKFGWHAMHRQFDPADFASDQHGRKVSHDGQPSHPHHGLGNGSTARRWSADHAHQANKWSGARSDARPGSLDSSAASPDHSGVAVFTDEQQQDHPRRSQQPQMARPPRANVGGGLAASRLARSSFEGPHDRRGLACGSGPGSSRSNSGTPPPPASRWGHDTASRETFLGGGGSAAPAAAVASLPVWTASAAGVGAGGASCGGKAVATQGSRGAPAAGQGAGAMRGMGAQQMVQV